jgi:hypothetical protein
MSSDVSQRDAPVRTRGDFVMLRAGSLRLLLPQQEVGAAEYVEHELRATGDAGIFDYGEGEGSRQVLALSQLMRPLAIYPQERFLLASLAPSEGGLSFAWDEVQVLIDADLERHPLPVAMQVAGAPISAYVERDGEILLCTTAEQMTMYAVAAMG